MSERKKHHKVLIIGGGPAGYTAAIYAARANLEPMCVEGWAAGGQLMTTTEVENFPGFPKGITGPELMKEMRAQAERFATALVTADVTRVDLTQRPFAVYTDDECTTADALIIATGATARYLGLPSEEALKGRGVSACAVCDGAFFKNEDVVVVGGGDTAMEEASYLANICKSVTLVHRRGEFRASKIMVQRVLNNPKIRVEYHAAVSEVTDVKAGRVTGVVLTDVRNGAQKTIACGGLFIAIGHQPNTELFKGALEMHDNGYLKVRPGSTATNIEGVFAAGDVADFHYRQAITAAGTGCMAALEAERWLGAQGLH